MRLHALALLASAAACGSGDASLVPGVDVLELRSSAGSGFCSGTVDLGADGSIDQRWVFVYENDRRKETQKVVENDGTVSEEYVLEYDHAGRIIAYDFLYGGERSLLSMVYDNAGRLLRSDSDYDGDGTVDRSRVVSAWTDFGAPLAARTTDTTEAVGWTSAYMYDSDGRLISRVDSLDDGTQRARVTVVYDDAAGTRTTTRSGKGYRPSTTVETFVDGRRGKIRDSYEGGWFQVEYTSSGGTLIETITSSDGEHTIGRYKLGC